MKKDNKNSQAKSVREMSLMTPRSLYQQHIASPYGLASSRENLRTRESLLMNERRYSDPSPLCSPTGTPFRRRCFTAPATFSDDVVLVDGVLVTSATGKKAPKPSSDSGSVGGGGSARSSGSRNPHKNSENCNIRSEIGHKQDNSPESFTGARRFTSTLRTPLGPLFGPGSASPLSFLELEDPPQSATGKGKAHATIPSKTGHKSEAKPPESFTDARLSKYMLRTPLGPLFGTGSASSLSLPKVPDPQQLAHSSFDTIGQPSEVYAPIGPHDYNPNSPLAHKLSLGGTTADSFHTPQPTPATGFSVPTTTNQRLTATNNTPINKHETKPEISKTENTNKTLSHTPTTTPGAASSSKKTNVLSLDWSPLDDGIEPTLPFQTEKSVSWEDVLIKDALFNPFKYKKRPTEFSKIVPDNTRLNSSGQTEQIQQTEQTEQTEQTQRTQQTEQTQQTQQTQQAQQTQQTQQTDSKKA